MKQEISSDEACQRVRRCILRDYAGMLHEPSGVLKYPFNTPGSVYARELWDWDSWLSSVALCQIMTDLGQNADRQKMLSFGRGCVLNFLSAARSDGEIPIRIKVNTPPAQRSDSSPRRACNMHKPVIAQHAAMLVKLDAGNASWLADGFDVLRRFMNRYRQQQFHEPTGLYFWIDDLAIGVDNDPATFFRPPGSSASIFLNCLMYKELRAMAYLAECLSLEESVVREHERQADALKQAIQKHCWDERDGYYYSVDLNLRPIDLSPGEYLDSTFILHKNHPRDYDCLVQRIEGWTGAMAMWAEIATPQQARRMVTERLTNPATLGARYGIRTLSKLEKMFGLYASNNPSNWNGPIWGISNYLGFRGMLKYGQLDAAAELADKTIELFARDFETNDALHEYYHPDTGAPIMNRGFQNWNYLVMNMIAWKQNRDVVAEF